MKIRIEIEIKVNLGNGYYLTATCPYSPWSSGKSPARAACIASAAALSTPKACWLIARRLQITIEDLAASERKGGEREGEGPHKIRPSTTMSNKRLSNVWK